MRRQWGVVARRQLVALGFGDVAICRAVARGRLERLHRGVYAVGHAALRREGHWLAAVLAGGEGAVLSHRSAAQLWELGSGGVLRIVVTTPREARSSPRGALLHRTRSLEPEERTQRRRVPVTSLFRTLVDVAADADRGELEKLIERAEVVHRIDAPALSAYAATAEVRA